jgi:hypothetical protein
MFHRRDLLAAATGTVLALAALGPAVLAEGICTQTFTDGPDEVYEIPLGEVCYGLGGDDVVDTVSGIFYGGPGDEQITYVYNGGIFYGGPGDDFVGSIWAASKKPCTGLVEGGAGDDTVWSNCGTFDGGTGNDYVYYNERHWHYDGGYDDAVFLGGAGDDGVGINEYGSAFWGDEGDDCVALNSGSIDSAVVDPACPY